MYDLVTLGEILIDFTPDTPAPGGFRRYIQNPGGAVVNVVATFAKYGAKAGFIGKVGQDLFGRYLSDYLTSLGVDCGGLQFDPDYHTTLAFVSLADNGDRDFAFYRKHEADTRLSPEEIPHTMLENTRLFHFGSLSLTAEPARSATYAALDTAKNAGALISYDPNYRESLWAGEDSITYMRSVLDRVDFIKVSEEEGEMLTGERVPEAIADALLSHGIRFAAVTLGEKGSYYATESCRGYAEPYKVRAIDTTGAGDVFFGTFLHEYLKKNVSLDDPEAVRSIVLRANKAAALCTTRKGGAPSVPDYSEI